MIALQEADELKPDVITLDIEMPEMDGLDDDPPAARSYFLKGMRDHVQHATTSRGASAALDALMLGANDYVTKPSNTGPMDSAKNHAARRTDPQDQAVL